MKSRLILPALAAALILTGCGAGTGSQQTGSQQTGAASRSVTVASCSEQLTFDRVPQRVVMLTDIDASTMSALGVLDKVTARAGEIRRGAYDDATFERLQQIPTISSEALESGGAKVSTESLLQARPDLVIGYDPGVDRDALRRAGVPFYSPDAFCADFRARASWDLVKQDVTKIGTIFGVEDRAAELNRRMDGEIAKLADTPRTSGTIAPIYVEENSPQIYAYGTASMVQPAMETNGLRNIYDSNPKRVFDASVEDLIKSDPDHILVLFGEGDPDRVRQQFLGFPGVGAMRAVRDNKVIVMSLSFFDPPTPLSVRGAELFSTRLQGQQ